MAQTVDPVVVVGPPAEDGGPGRGVALEQSDHSTPVGFVTGYVGLTVLGLVVAATAGGRRPAAPTRTAPGLGIAYGRRSGADFWADPAPPATGRRRRSVPG